MRWLVGIGIVAAIAGQCSAGWLGPAAGGASGWFIDGRADAPVADAVSAILATGTVFRLAQSDGQATAVLTNLDLVVTTTTPVYTTNIVVESITTVVSTSVLAVAETNWSGDILVSDNDTYSGIYHGTYFVNGSVPDDGPGGFFLTNAEKGLVLYFYAPGGVRFNTVFYTLDWEGLWGTRDWSTPVITLPMTEAGDYDSPDQSSVTFSLAEVVLPAGTTNIVTLVTTNLTTNVVFSIATNTFPLLRLIAASPAPQFPSSALPPVCSGNDDAVYNGGLIPGQLYRDAADPDHLCIVH